MSGFKWSLIFLLVIMPLLLMGAEYMAHSTTVADADSATRSAAQSMIKANIQKNSLRDTDIYRNQHVVQFNADDIQRIFDGSVTRKVMEDGDGKGYITIARGAGEAGERIQSFTGNPYPIIGGFQMSPPMLAIRSNVVRESVMFHYLGKFAKVNPYRNIQHQKIAILEMKDTE